MEEWRDIKGYEGKYQVSNLGRIKRLHQFRVGKTGRKCELSETIMSVNQRGDYYTVTLQKKCFRVHRLVAQAFIPNPDSLPEVNHKDENKLNNCVENLEWCTHQYNQAYGTKGQRSSIYQKQFYSTADGERLKKQISKSLIQHFSENGSHRKGTHVTPEQVEHIRQGAILGWKYRKLKDRLKGDDE